MLTALLFATTLTTVDLSRDFRDAAVELTGDAEGILLLVADEGAPPRLVWDDVALCDDVRFGAPERTAAGLWRIAALPEFEIDDGANTCAVTVTQPSGAKATVHVSIYVDN